VRKKEKTKEKPKNEHWRRIWYEVTLQRVAFFGGAVQCVALATQLPN